MILELARPGHRDRLRALFSSKPYVEQTCAVVVGDSVNALGVVRSLGKEQIKVVLVTSNPNSFVLVSRFVDQIIVCQDVYYENLIPSLKDLGSLFLNQPVLFLTHDFQVKQVGAHQKTLLDFYRFQFPSSDTVEQLLSKRHFFQLAQEHGLEVPTTHSISQYKELEEYVSLCSDEESYVVKPVEKNDEFEKYFGKALRIKGDKEWNKFLQTFKKVDCPILIQNWILGGDHHILFCLVVFDEESDCIMSFCGRKLNQYKPEIGSTASASMYDSQDVRNATIQFFQKISFTGMGSLEFKFCETTKHLYAIEPTVGRTNLQSEVSTINGCNLAAMYYYGVIGGLKKRQFYIENAYCSNKNQVWMRFVPDLKSAWFHYQRNHITLREWLCSYFRPISYSVFRWNDPAPFLKLVFKNFIGLTLGILKCLKEKIIHVSWGLFF